MNWGKWPRIRARESAKGTRRIRHLQARRVYRRFTCTKGSFRSCRLTSKNCGVLTRRTTWLLLKTQVKRIKTTTSSTCRYSTHSSESKTWSVPPQEALVPSHLASRKLDWSKRANPLRPRAGTNQLASTLLRRTLLRVSERPTRLEVLTRFGYHKNTRVLKLIIQTITESHQLAANKDPTWQIPLGNPRTVTSLSRG